MKTMTSWESVLAAPSPCDHLVQLYTSERVLAGTVSDFVARGLGASSGVIAIATAAHWRAIAAALSARSIDVAAAQARHQLIVLDAADTVGRLTAGGALDRAAMHHAIGPAIQAARGAGYATVRAYGEMVDVLYRAGDLAGALRLEALWNELLQAEGMALLCVYAVDAFDPGVYAAALPGIEAVHSHLMLVDDPHRLERAIDLAFVDVFGLHGDTRLLRELIIRQLPDRAAMPAAHGALLALRTMDRRLADTVLARAAGHYRRAA